MLGKYSINKSIRILMVIYKKKMKHQMKQKLVSQRAWLVCSNGVTSLNWMVKTFKGRTFF